MSEKEIYEALNEIFRDVFDDDDIELNAETTSEDIDGWDSLANINIIVSIENEFNIKFEMNEITDMKSVGEIVKVIMERAA